jgi:hypothetical protein
VQFNQPGITIIGCAIQDIPTPCSDDEATYLFTGNGEFTFIWSGYETTGMMTATVDRIDRIAPTATIVYTPLTPTVGPVIATLTLNETGTVEGRMQLTATTAMKVYLANTTETATFADSAGNTGSASLSINRITPPAA